MPLLGLSANPEQEDNNKCQDAGQCSADSCVKLEFRNVSEQLIQQSYSHPATMLFTGSGQPCNEMQIALVNTGVKAVKIPPSNTRHGNSFELIIAGSPGDKQSCAIAEQILQGLQPISIQFGNIDKTNDSKISNPQTLDIEKWKIDKHENYLLLYPEPEDKPAEIILQQNQCLHINFAHLDLPSTDKNLKPISVTLRLTFDYEALSDRWDSTKISWIRPDFPFFEFNTEKRPKLHELVNIHFMEAPSGQDNPPGKVYISNKDWDFGNDLYLSITTKDHEPIDLTGAEFSLDLSYGQHSIHTLIRKEEVSSCQFLLVHENNESGWDTQTKTVDGAQTWRARALGALRLQADESLVLAFKNVRSKTAVGDGFIALSHWNIGNAKDAETIIRVPKRIPEAQVLDFNVAVKNKTEEGLQLEFSWNCIGYQKGMLETKWRIFSEKAKINKYIQPFHGTITPEDLTEHLFQGFHDFADFELAPAQGTLSRQNTRRFRLTPRSCIKTFEIIDPKSSYLLSDSIEFRLHYVDDLQFSGGILECKEFPGISKIIAGDDDFVITVVLQLKPSVIKQTEGNLTFVFKYIDGKGEVNSKVENNEITVKLAPIQAASFNAKCRIEDNSSESFSSARTMPLLEWTFEITPVSNSPINNWIIYDFTNKKDIEASRVPDPSRKDITEYTKTNSIDTSLLVKAYDNDPVFLEYRLIPAPFYKSTDNPFDDQYEHVWQRWRLYPPFLTWVSKSEQGEKSHLELSFEMPNDLRNPKTGAPMKNIAFHIAGDKYQVGYENKLISLAKNGDGIWELSDKNQNWGWKADLSYIENCQENPRKLRYQITAVIPRMRYGDKLFFFEEDHNVGYQLRYQLEICSF